MNKPSFLRRLGGSTVARCVAVAVLLVALAGIHYAPIAKGPGGNTALHWAAAGGHKYLGELLLANGADVNARNNEGETPLLWGAYHGHMPFATLEMVDPRNHEALSHNYEDYRDYNDMVELLLTHGADVNAKDNAGSTPLDTASGYGDKEMVELLLAHGADVHDGGEAPLFQAARCGHTAVAELLLAHGAKINAKDHKGMTPLHWAVEMGNNKDVVEVLLAHGADVNAKTKYGETPLMAAKENGYSPDVADLLRQHGGHE